MLGVASSRRYARITARMHILARICATKHYPTKSLATNIGTIPKNMPTNFQPKRLKLKLDIVEKPENRVHKLTDSNAERSLDTVVRAVSASVLPVWVDFTSLKGLPCAPGPATTRRGMLKRVSG